MVLGSFHKPAPSHSSRFDVRSGIHGGTTEVPSVSGVSKSIVGYEHRTPSIAHVLNRWRGGGTKKRGKKLPPKKNPTDGPLLLQLTAPSMELEHNAIEIPTSELDRLGIVAGSLVRLRGRRGMTTVPRLVPRFVEGRLLPRALYFTIFCHVFRCRWPSSVQSKTGTCVWPKVTMLLLLCRCTGLALVHARCETCGLKMLDSCASMR